MRDRRSQSRRRSSGRRYRPGFEPPKQRTFPWWLVPVALVVIGLIIGGIWLLRSKTEDNTGTPTTSPTLATITPSPDPTETATPTPTPTPVTMPCTVVEEAVLHNEPTVGSIGQDLASGKLVNVIDTVESDGYTWYRVMLPGYDEIRYIRIEAVECE